MLSLTIVTVDCLDAEDKTSVIGGGNSFRWGLAGFKGNFFFSYY